jgi:hypothetical protein
MIDLLLQLAYVAIVLALISLFVCTLPVWLIVLVVVLLLRWSGHYHNREERHHDGKDWDYSDNWKPLETHGGGKCRSDRGVMSNWQDSLQKALYSSVSWADGYRPELRKHRN